MADRQIVYDDIDKVCRGCLGKKGEMRPLYGSCLDTMLMTVAEIQVHAGDGLPELMCVQCVLQVSRAFTFKQQCQRSDATLRLYCRHYVETTLVEDEEDGLGAQQQPVEVQFENPDGDKCVLLVQHMESGDSNVSLGSQHVIQVLTAVDDEEGNSRATMQMSHEMPVKLLTGQGDDDDDDQNHDHRMDLIEINANDQLSDGMQAAMVSSQPNVKIDQDYSVAFADHSCNVNDSSVGEFIVSNNDCGLFCTDCGMEFDNTHQLQLHRLKMHLSSQQSHAAAAPIDHNTGNKTSSGCDDCTIDFGRNNTTNDKLHRTTASTHLVATPPTVTANVPLQFQCDVCQKCFGESKILRRHMKTHNPHKPHVCPTCNMSFAESSNLTKHTKKHTGELRNIVGKPNLCSVCGKRFKWASSLSKHMKHHTKHKILNCPYCPKYYVEARSLSIHIRSHTGEKPYVCELCQKGFTQMGNLEKHMRVHTGEKPFVCPVCGKGFSQSGYVAIHIRTHTGERPYQCNECGKGFAGSNTLAIHKRTHTGERPYPCGICGKTFARQETAVIHQRTHTGEKPHVCTICHRGFTSSGHLTGHMRSHSGLKPHECAVCQKRFAGSSSLKVHMRGHSVDKVFRCGVCSASFDDEMTLEEHELEHDFGVAVAAPSTGIKHDGGLGDVIQLTEEIIDSSELIISNEPLM